MAKIKWFHSGVKGNKFFGKAYKSEYILNNSTSGGNKEEIEK